LDGAGHMLQIEKRKIVQELIKDWLIIVQVGFRLKSN
ncbi:alpha/beta fold hydrolase, partial [Bacillus sp. B-TM1]